MVINMTNLDMATFYFDYSNVVCNVNIFSAFVSTLKIDLKKYLETIEKKWNKFYQLNCLAIKIKQAIWTFTLMSKRITIAQKTS